MPAMARGVNEMTPDDYKRALHALQEMKPTAFDEAKQCIATWHPKNFDEVRVCVARAFDFDKPPGISDLDFLQVLIVKTNTNSAMAKCIVERNGQQSPSMWRPLTQETWDYCLDNANLPVTTQ